MNASGMQQELDSSGRNRECVEARLAKESIVIEKSADIIECGVEGSKDVSSEEHLLSPKSLGGSLERNCIKEHNLPPDLLPGGQDERLCGSERCLEAHSEHEGIDFNRGKRKKKGQVLDTAFPGQLLECWKKDPCPHLPLVSEAKDSQEDPFRVPQTRWKVEGTHSNDCVSGRGDNDLALTGVRKGTVSISSQAETDEAKCEEDTVLDFESVPKLCPNQSIKTNVLIKPCFVLLKDIGREIEAKRERCLIQPNVMKLPQETQSRKKTVFKEPKVILCDIMKRVNADNLKKPPQMQKDAKENQKKKGYELNNSANKPCSEETNLVYEGKKIESEECSRDLSSFCDVGIFTKLSNYINSFVGPDHINENVNGKGSLPVDSAPFPDTQKTSFTEAKAPKVSDPQVGTSFALPDEADLSESACESQSCILSLRSGDNLKFDTKDTVPSKIPSQMPREPCPLTEEGIPKQVDVSEVERLKQSNSEDGDGCWFLLKIDKIIEVDDSMFVTDENNMAREPDCGDVPLSPGNGLPQSEIDSGCELQTDDAENIEKLTKNRSMELCGPTVKLLGTPSDNDERLSLGRLIALEDASSDEKRDTKEPNTVLVGGGQSIAYQGTRARRSANGRTERKTYPVCTVWPKSSSSGGSRAKRKQTQEDPPATHRTLSESQSRNYVVDALRKTLQKRLDDSHDLNVQENTVRKLAERIERALFKLFCSVDQHYKNKYRSLRFNLKSTDEVLFRKVVLGEITPKRLVQMTSLEMAPKELAEWRVSENKRVLKVIEREEQEAQRSCPTKFTHKGIVEIHREVDEDLALQEIHESQPLDSKCEASERNPSVKHLRHTSDSACSTSTKQKAVISQKGFVPSHSEKRENKISKRDHSNSPCLYGEERSLPEDSIPKKHSRTEKQPRSTIVWNGLIEMFGLKHFAAKAYPVSGSVSHLTEALPLLLQSMGCISPEDVWVCLDSLWPANSKEMGIIRFCPSLPKSHSPYNMLYSYLNNKQRYGIVKTSQVEMFMVSLAAFQPLPSKLHKLGGPGLDSCHPSLLLGLILPKKTTSILVTRASLVQKTIPKDKRKKVTFKDSTETKRSDPPSHLPMDTSLAQPPRQLPMPGLPCENEGPQDPLVVDGLCSLSEEVAGAMPSSTHCENTADCTNLSSRGSLLQTMSNYPWTEGQTLGTLEPQPYQTMYPGQYGMDSDPSYSWNSLGFFLPSESVYPNQHEAFDTMFFPNQLCAEVAPSHEVSPASWLHQIPCTTSEPPNSIMEEILNTVQRVQPHLQIQPMMSTAVGLPATPQEDSSTLPQDVTGLDLPPDLQDCDMFAHLQLLVSSLGGQAQPPSAI